MSEDRQDTDVTPSGGTVRRVTTPPTDAVADLAVLEALRTPADGLTTPTARFAPGTVIGWHYHIAAHPMRVVRDDDRGLVAWLPAGSVGTFFEARDGRGLRDRSVAERSELLLAGDFDEVPHTWTGGGILRIAPTGRPWSIWWFWDPDNAELPVEYYVNLELPHLRPVDGSPHVFSRDLVLDLCVEPHGDGWQTWMKDEDELDAFTEVGYLSAEQREQILALAEQVRREVIEPRAWPFDEGWDSWRPPPGWEEPLTLPLENGGQRFI